MIANTAQHKYQPTGAAFEDVTVGETRYLSARQHSSAAPTLVLRVPRSAYNANVN